MVPQDEDGTGDVLDEREGAGALGLRDGDLSL